MATPVPSRWTRDYLYDILDHLGIRAIFGVPGTNEIPLIDGTQAPGSKVSYVQCLHENIAFGAAMGNARMTGLPGVVIVHVTPGIAHGIGNLFNAYRSGIPLVILCCQQQNELVTQEPLLASNLVEVASQYTKWSHEVRAWKEIPLVFQRAFKEAMAPPAGPVFISIPWEFTLRSIDAGDRIRGVTKVAPGFVGDRAVIAEAAKALVEAKNPIIVAGDGVGSANAWKEIVELAELAGAPVVSQSFSSVANYPNDDYHWLGELPGAQASVQNVFKSHDVAFLVGFGAQAQLAVFKYSDGPLFPDGLRQISLSNDPWDLGKNYFSEVAILGDPKATLPEIAAQLRKHPNPGAAKRNHTLQEGAKKRKASWNAYIAEAKAQKDIWAVLIADELRAVIAEWKLGRKFVFVNEAVSDPAPFQYLLPLGSEGAVPTSYYCVAGGSLGWSMPASLGISFERKGAQGIDVELVINAVGDGSSLFYPQVWWTAGHAKLAVLYIITNNREYHTLQLGLKQVVDAYGGVEGYGWHPFSMDPSYLRIEKPDVDLIGLAKSFGGVEGATVRTIPELGPAIRSAVDYVLKNRKSFVLDVRTAQDVTQPPAPAVANAAGLEAAAPDAAPAVATSRQPALDYVHEPTDSDGRRKKYTAVF